MLENKFNILAILTLTVFVLIKQSHGHGMMLDPVSRSSRWRYNRSAPINYDDNGLFCGGLSVQWFRNNGKCGLCGDDFAAPMPRQNELGGKYGQGVITEAYFQSQNARLGIKITTNHLGFFYFNICNLDKFKVESEICFNANQIKFSDGSLKMYIGKKSGMIYPNIILPKGLNCKHCVLRWNYQAGNNWGPCGNGTSAIGCGPQENFKGCSDISIRTKYARTKTHLHKKLFKTIPNINNNLDYDYFVPTKKPHSISPLDKYFDKSSKNNDFNSFVFEEKTLPVFDKKVNIDIDNILRESEIVKQTVPVFVKDTFSEEDEGLDKRVVFGFKEMHKTIPDPELSKADQYAKKIDSYLNLLNVLYGFGKEESPANNGIDDSFNYLEYD